MTSGMLPRMAGRWLATQRPNTRRRDVRLGEAAICSANFDSGVPPIGSSCANSNWSRIRSLASVRKGPTVEESADLKSYALTLLAESANLGAQD